MEGEEDNEENQKGDSETANPPVCCDRAGSLARDGNVFFGGRGISVSPCCPEHEKYEEQARER